MKIGFDNEKYLALQAEHIRQRMSQFGGKLYLEFGGKLFGLFSFLPPKKEYSHTIQLDIYSD